MNSDQFSPHNIKYNIGSRKSFLLFASLTFIVIINLTSNNNNDAFAITYHYEPFFTADGSTILDVANNPTLQLTRFTVATWFKTSTNFPDEGIMVNKGGLGSESPGANQNYGLWFTSAERLQGGFESSSGSNKYVTSSNILNDGQWHHGLVTFDGSIVRLYVDGIQIGTLSTTSTPDNTGTQPLRIAGNAQSLVEDFFVGQIDEVGVWNRALTSNEITNLIANGVFPSSGLIFSNSFNSIPTPEICGDNIDNDGDGLVDEGCPAPPPPSNVGYHYEPFLVINDPTDIVDVPNAQNLKLSKFSVATWFKTSTNFPSDGILVNKGGLSTDSSGNNMNYGIWMTSSEKLRGGFETSSGSNNYATSTNSYNNGQWHHGVVTFDGSIVRLYVDGIQVTQLSTLSAPETTGNHPLRIGADSRIVDDLFTGNLDEVGVWNRALTSNEIANLKDNGLFSTNGLVYNNSFTNASPQPPPEICGDAIDNDGDGFIDEGCPLPPPSGEIYPIQNITWIYDSQLTLSKDITLVAGHPHPTDPVLFPSSASGVDSVSIRNSWLEVESGGGDGRVYWNYHEVPQFSQIPTMGYNTVMTGKFMFKPGIDNLSIKDGNHGTNGWVLDGQLVFGGFGIAFHRSEVESKVEYWHNRQGSGVTVSYPIGLNLVDNKEYKFFVVYQTDRVKQEVVLNGWLDFGDGKGWIQVMKDRKWGQIGWSPGTVPEGDDKTDILKGPSFIKKHHIWTRANGVGILPIKDIKIGTLNFIS